jgi:methionyl aminopeptidase
MYHHGYHGDLNATFPVGPKAKANETDMLLIKTARDCLDAAIALCGPGVPYAEIGRVIQPLAEERGFAVVKVRGNKSDCCSKCNLLTKLLCMLSEIHWTWY